MTDTASPFNPRLVIGLIFAATFAFAALLLLLAYGGDSRSGRGDRADSRSVAATGFKGLVDLVGALGQAHLDETTDEWADHLLIVTLDQRHRPADVRALLDQRGNYPTLIILPKWATVNDPEHRGWVRALEPGMGRMFGRHFGESARVSLTSGRPPASVPGEGVLEGLDIAVPPNAQTISGGELTPVAALPDGGALIAQLGSRPHFVVADPDLMNNHGLRDPARARGALAILQRMNGREAPIDFDLTRGGGRSDRPSLLQLAFEPPLLAMTLALFVAALLAGFYGAFRFGPARREQRAIALGKAALVENSAGLIRLARREARLGGAYADVVRTEAARATGAPSWLGSEKLDAYLDRLGRAGEARFTVLAAAVAAATDRASLMAAARELHEWKRGLVK
jgi:hypothetical protein